MNSSTEFTTARDRKAPGGSTHTSPAFTGACANSLQPQWKFSRSSRGAGCLNGLWADMGYSNGQENTGTRVEQDHTKSVLFWLCWNSVTSASQSMRWSVLTVRIENCVQYLETIMFPVYRHISIPIFWTNQCNELNRKYTPILRGALGLSMATAFFALGLLCLVKSRSPFLSTSKRQ